MSEHRDGVTFVVLAVGCGMWSRSNGSAQGRTGSDCILGWGPSFICDIYSRFQP